MDLTLDGAPLTIEFSAIDDFHPDRLFARLAPFVALRKLRAELNDPSTFHRAAQALGGRPAAGAGQPPVNAEENAADIERLLGKKPTAAPAGGDAGGFDVDQWLRTVIAPHIVPDGAEVRQLVGAVDAALAEQMRGVLHHPEFQALEAVWRGIDRIVRELETGETLQIFVLEASHDELARDFAGAADDFTQCSLYRVLCGPETEPPDGHRWSLLVGDYAFGVSLDDARLLAVLGAMAAQSGAPLLAGARPGLLGCTSAMQLSDPAAWPRVDVQAQARWDALRKCAAAPFIGLALPRVITRLPYGAGTDPIDSFAFEEMPDTRDHDAYLWGNPAFTLALLAAQAFQEGGWDMELDGQVDAVDLPAHIYHEGGEAKQQACAEVLLSETAGEATLARGVMPFLSYRNRDAARLLRWQSIADPPQTLQGAWAANSTS